MIFAPMNDARSCSVTNEWCIRSETLINQSFNQSISFMVLFFSYFNQSINQGCCSNQEPDHWPAQRNHTAVRWRPNFSDRARQKARPFRRHRPYLDSQVGQNPAENVPTARDRTSSSFRQWVGWPVAAGILRPTAPSAFLPALTLFWRGFRVCQPGFQNGIYLIYRYTGLAA